MRATEYIMQLLVNFEITSFSFYQGRFYRAPRRFMLKIEFECYYYLYIHVGLFSGLVSCLYRIHRG